MSTINDVYLLNGLGDILNKDNVKPDIDVKDVEMNMVKGTGYRQDSIPKEDRLMREVEDAMRMIGMKPEESRVDEPRAARGRPEPTQSYARDDTYSRPRPVEYAAPPQQQERSYGINMDDLESDPAQDYRQDNRSEFDEQTREEQRRSHINNVVGGDKPSLQDFSFEKEREEDYKCEMLAEIDYLVEGLKDAGVDTSRIPTVDDSADVASIEKIVKVLRHKVDHSRYCTFAEEFILSGAHGFEYLFDGKNMWFGRWNPNLTGWHTQVNRKLRRMRTDTGKIVSHIMNDYDIGPFMRICLELVPNMFLFSTRKSEENSLSNLNLDSSISESSSKLRNL